MKKILSTLLILSLLCMLVMPVLAADKPNDIEDIRVMLNSDYNGVETETQFGYFVPEFTVFKDKDGVINICADSWNFVFRDIAITRGLYVEKQNAKVSIKKHMEAIANAVINKYPQYKFKGWYESNFDNFYGKQVSFHLDTWTNIKDGSITKEVIWMLDQDSDWNMLK